MKSVNQHRNLSRNAILEQKESERIVGNESENIDEKNSEINSLVNSFLKVGDYLNAVEVLNCAVEIDEKDAESWLQLGELYADLDEDIKAIRALSKAIDLDSKCKAALISLSVCYANEQNIEESTKCLMRWTLLSYSDRFNDSVQNLVANSGFSSQQKLETLANILKMEVDITDKSVYPIANTKNSDIVGLYTVAGIVNTLLENKQNACELFARALEVDKTNFRLWNRLGATLANMKEYTDAIEVYYEALSINKFYPRSLVNLGIAYANKKSNFQALQAYVYALKHNPKAVHIWSYLSRLVGSSTITSNLSNIKQNKNLTGISDISNELQTGFDLKDVSNLSELEIQDLLSAHFGYSEILQGLNLQYQSQPRSYNSYSNNDSALYTETTEDYFNSALTHALGYEELTRDVISTNSSSDNLFNTTSLNNVENSSILNNQESIPMLNKIQWQILEKDLPNLSELVPEPRLRNGGGNEILSRLQNKN